MVRRRNREFCGRPEIFPVDKRSVVSIGDMPLENGVHFMRPVVTVTGLVDPVEVNHAQVVDHISAADDEIAFTAQRLELLPEVVMVSARLGIIDAELDDGNIGLGVYVL